MTPTGNTSPIISTFAEINEFDSALALSEPNLLDTPLHQLDVTSESTDFLLLPDDGFDSGNTKSGSDNPEGGGSGEDQGQSQEPRPDKKKKYHRHTPHQIQEMEAFFKQCPHPDDKQRKELSQELGLDPLQVKFWFQNKRTQMKAQGERHENTQLKNENERLRADNIQYREALRNASCPNCGGATALSEMSFEEHHLRLENARLREEIDKISIAAANHIREPMTSYPLLPSTVRALELGAGGFGGQEAADIGGDMYMAGGLLRSMSAPSETERNMILQLAVSAMQEFITMAQTGQPLWVPNPDATYVVLNEEEYLRRFPRGFGLKLNGFRCEASKESAVIVMNHLNLVEYLMDVHQWSAVFSGIVSKAFTLEVLSTGGAGNYNGALQVMAAELNLPTPLVDVRESYFVRYCKQHGEGIWAVVDVSLDNIRQIPTSNCRKRPSGCLIQETPSGYSKVTWIENVEIDEGGAHSLYKSLISSGTVFGAKRWLATLDRQCERLATALATNIPIGVIASQLGVKSTLKLAERMVLSFCHGVSPQTAQIWTSLAGTGADDVRVVSRMCENDPGRPSGLILSAATTLWLPAAPSQVFDYLRNENSRPQWDILSSGGMVERMAHIEIGRTASNCVSLLKVNNANSSQSNMLILQESCTDSVVSLVVYAPVEMNAMNVVVHGGDSDYVEILPSGFAIFPDGASGSLLTVSFQILVEALPASKLTVNSVATVNNLIACTVDRLRAGLLS